jgi:hypothetical protein
VTFQKLARLNRVIGSNFIWPCHITANKWDYLNPFAFNSKGTLLHGHNAYLAFWAKEIGELKFCLNFHLAKSHQMKGTITSLLL